MLYNTYVYKSEHIVEDENCTVYVYRDCFTHQKARVLVGDDEIFADLKYESENRLICDGEYIAGDITDHIIRLMSPHPDDMGFSYINVLLAVDGVVSCSLELSTRYIDVTDIDNFIRTLIISTENTGECKLTLDFSSPDKDADTFTLKKIY